MTPTEVKRLTLSLGADLVGIAAVDRLGEAPPGYRPTDVMPSCRSVVSFACAFPVGTLYCRSAVPYTRVRNSITPKMDAIALELCRALERAGIVSAPVPANECQWDASTERWRSIVSQKHAAQAAGLGCIGRHSLLITPEYGSMVWLGCVLTEAEWPSDPRKENVCIACGRCVEACPVDALDDRQLAQMTCQNYAFGDDPENKIWQISCHRCRDVCPFNLGTVNAALKRPLPQ